MSNVCQDAGETTYLVVLRVRDIERNMRIDTLNQSTARLFVLFLSKLVAENAQCFVAPTSYHFWRRVDGVDDFARLISHRQFCRLVLEWRVSPSGLLRCTLARLLPD